MSFGFVTHACQTKMLSRIKDGTQCDVHESTLLAAYRALASKALFQYDSCGRKIRREDVSAFNEICTQKSLPGSRASGSRRVTNVRNQTTTHFKRQGSARGPEEQKRLSASFCCDIRLRPSEPALSRAQFLRHEPMGLSVGVGCKTLCRTSIKPCLSPSMTTV
jgi:hypothetical protein